MGRVLLNLNIGQHREEVLDNELRWLGPVFRVAELSSGDLPVGLVSLRYSVCLSSGLTRSETLLLVRTFKAEMESLSVQT